LFGTAEMWIVISVLLVAVLIGVHIAVALGLTAALGIYLMTGNLDGLMIFIGNTAYEALRDYVFASGGCPRARRPCRRGRAPGPCR
jgi:hypothetical protein